MDLSLRDSIALILDDYENAQKESLGGHPLAAFIRNTFPNLIKTLIDNSEGYLVQGSAGQGNWARCPWIAVFDILITETAQTGYYPVYLFREDMKGVYLSLNQGVTEIRQKYKENPKEVLKIKASDFRAQIGGLPNRFPSTKINLATGTTTDLASFYEAGNIFSVFYEKDKLPTEEGLILDFIDMMEHYQFLSSNETAVESLHIGDHSENLGKTEEDLRNFRQHWRVERNRKLSKAAKKVHGYTCQGCDFNFEEKYGEIGKDYIEAHHLVPISLFKGQVVKLDPKLDFAVLCSNCHRMIHRTENPNNISAFRQNIKKNK
jgi:5-methylcytosine-specific restriction protein A